MQKRYQALSAIHICVPGEPGNEASMKPYQKNLMSPLIRMASLSCLRANSATLCILSLNGLCNCRSMWLFALLMHIHYAHCYIFDTHMIGMDTIDRSVGWLVGRSDNVPVDHASVGLAQAGPND